MVFGNWYLVIQDYWILLFVLLLCFSLSYPISYPIELLVTHCNIWCAKCIPTEHQFIINMEILFMFSVDQQVAAASCVYNSSLLYRSIKRIFYYLSVEISPKQTYISCFVLKHFDVLLKRKSWYPKFINSQDSCSPYGID